MKPGTLVTKIIVAVFALAMAAYLGSHIYRLATSDLATATLYEYVAEERVETTGWFFRTEVVMEESSPLAEVLLAEGERVGKGDRLARIYHSDEGYTLQQELEKSNARLESLYYILNREDVSADAMELDDRIVDGFTAVRGDVAAGSYADLPDSIADIQALMFRRDYTYNGSSELRDEIQLLEAYIRELEGRVSQAYDSVISPAAGVYSAMVDGYEGALDPALIPQLTPAALEQLTAAPVPVDENCVGKVITGADWYFVCNVTREEGERFREGQEAILRFGDSSRLFEVEICYLSAPENGEMTVAFVSDEYLAQCSWLRNQSVDIITDRITGFRVPKSAVRVAEDGAAGVFRVAGALLEWVNIEVLWEEDDYYIIADAPILDEEGNRVEQSAMEEAKRLRAGDEVAIRGQDLYDGKVVT